MLTMTCHKHDYKHYSVVTDATLAMPLIIVQHTVYTLLASNHANIKYIDSSVSN